MSESKVWEQEMIIRFFISFCIYQKRQKLPLPQLRQSLDIADKNSVVLVI